MEKLLLLLVAHIGTVTTIMKLVQQGVEIAPKIIEDAVKQFNAIADFWKEGRLPTQEEMDALIAKRKALEDSILAVTP